MLTSGHRSLTTDGLNLYLVFGYLVLLAVLCVLQTGPAGVSVVAWNDLSLATDVYAAIWLPYALLGIGWLVLESLTSRYETIPTVRRAALGIVVSFSCTTLATWAGGFVGFQPKAILLLLGWLCFALLLIERKRRLPEIHSVAAIQHNHKLLLVGVLILAIGISGSLYVFSNQPYLVAGDQTRLVHIADFDARGNEYRFIPENNSIATYPYFGGLFLNGFSSFLGLPPGNALVLLSVLSALLVPLISFALADCIWPVKSGEKYLRYLLYIVGGGLGGLFYVCRLFPNFDWFTVSYVTQDIYDSPKLGSSLLVDPRTIGVFLMVGGCLLYLEALQESLNSRDRSTLFFLSAVAAAVSFLAHIEDLLLVYLPFVILIQTTSLARKNRLPSIATLFLTLGIILAADSITAEYTIRILLSKFLFSYNLGRFILAPLDLSLLLAGGTIASALLVFRHRIAVCLSYLWSRIIPPEVHGVKVIILVCVGFWVIGLLDWFLMARTGQILQYPLLSNVSTGYPPVVLVTSLGLLGLVSLWAIFDPKVFGVEMRRFTVLWFLVLVICSILTYGARFSAIAAIPLVILASHSLQRLRASIHAGKSGFAQRSRKAITGIALLAIIVVSSLSWASLAVGYSTWPPGVKPIDSSFVDVLQHASETIGAGQTVLFLNNVQAEFAGDFDFFNSTLPLSNPWATNYAAKQEQWSQIVQGTDLSTSIDAFRRANPAYLIVSKVDLQSLGGFMRLIADISNVSYSNEDYLNLKLPHLSSGFPSNLSVPFPYTYSGAAYYNTSSLAQDESVFTGYVDQLLKANFSFERALSLTGPSVNVNYVSSPTNEPVFSHVTYSNGSRSVYVKSSSSIDSFYFVRFQLPSLNLSEYPFLLVNCRINNTSIYGVDVTIHRGNASYPVTYGRSFPIYLSKTNSSETQLLMIPPGFENYTGLVTIDLQIWTRNTQPYVVTLSQLELVRP